MRVADPGAAAPDPGDLLLDVGVPECERVTVSRNGWSASATHVWTGTGWVRLLPGTVRRRPEPVRRVDAASVADGDAAAPAVVPPGPVATAPVPPAPAAPAPVPPAEEEAPTQVPAAASDERTAAVRSMPARLQRQPSPRRAPRRPAV